METRKWFGTNDEVSNLNFTSVIDLIYLVITYAKSPLLTRKGKPLAARLDHILHPNI